MMKNVVAISQATASTCTTNMLGGSAGISLLSKSKQVMCPPGLIGKSNVT